jgi:hypothetical protein
MECGAGLVAAILLLAPGVPAAAVIMQVSLAGAVTSGTDLCGVFGSAGADLAGSAYNSCYIYDTELGALFTDTDFIQVYGGSVYGLGTPIVSSSISITGFTFGIGGNWQAYIKANTINRRRFLKYYSDDSEDTSTTLAFSILMQDWSAFYRRTYPPTGITTPLSYTMDPSCDATSGSLTYQVYDIASETFLAKTSLWLKPASIFVSPSGGIAPPPSPPPSLPPPPPPPNPGEPEPSNWALLIAGFRMTDMASRRSRTKFARVR